MTSEQVGSLARFLMNAMGTLLVAQGALTPAQSSSLSTGVEMAVGGLFMVIPLVWGMIRHRRQ